MPIEWQVESRNLEDQEAIDGLLQSQYEPFGLYKGELWLKRMVHVEAREPRSSTLEENQQRDAYGEDAAHD